MTFCIKLVVDEAGNKLICIKWHVFFNHNIMIDNALTCSVLFRFVFGIFLSLSRSFSVFLWIVHFTSSANSLVFCRRSSSFKAHPFHRVLLFLLLFNCLLCSFQRKRFHIQIVNMRFSFVLPFNRMSVTFGLAPLVSVRLDRRQIKSRIKNKKSCNVFWSTATVTHFLSIFRSFDRHTLFILQHYASSTVCTHRFLLLRHFVD